MPAAPRRAPRSSPSRTSPRAAGSTSSSGSRRRSERRRRPPPRPDERREPQPLGVHARRAGRPRRRRPRAARRGARSTRSTWSSTRASTRGSGPSTSSRSCRSATRRWTSASSSPGRSGERIAERFDLPVYLYAEAATRPRAGQAGRRPARPVRGAARPRSRQRGREPDFGPAGCTRRPARSRSAPGRSSSPTTSTSSRRTRELAKRIARRVRESGGGLPTVQANGFFIEELGRAQVSMNLLDFRVTPLWRVWETVRAEAAEDGVELAESELIGLAPLAAFLDVADHVEAPADAPVERAPGRRRGVPPAPRLLADAGARAAPRGRPRRRAATDGGPAAVTLRRHRGRPERRAAPGLLVVGAAEVVTMAGGLRTGSGQGDVGRLLGGGRRRTRRAAAPGRRRLGGPDRRRRARAPTSSGCSRARATRSGRFARLDALGGDGHARASSIRTRTCCSPAPARTSSSCASAAPATSRSSPPAAGSSRRWRRPGRRPPTSSRAHGRRWLDEMLGHGATTIEAKSGYGLDLADRAPAARGRASARAGGPDRRRPDVPRRPRRPARVPRPAGRHRGLRPQRHRGAAAGRRGPGPGAVLRRLLRGGRVHAPTSRGGSCEAAAALGLAPRLHADELVPVRRRGAGRRDRGGLGRPPRDAVGGRHRRAGRAAAEGRPVVATLLPATTWFLMKDHDAPARTFIERGVPVAIGTDFNPGTSPTPTCRWR